MGALLADVKFVNDAPSVGVRCVHSLGADCSFVQTDDLRVNAKYMNELSVGVGCANVRVFVKIEFDQHLVPPAPYLEIEPTLIWVYPDWAVDNEVFSNTNWNVN